MYFVITDKYITTAQDTIYKIAMRFYFKWHLWRVIYDYNKDSLGSNPLNLPAGRSVQIIGLNTEEIFHIIQSGDTWVKLSREYYGSEVYWVNIARANKYKHLVPDETVIIPALLAGKDLENARELRNVCA